MNRFKILMGCVLVLFAFSSLFAQSNARLGTSGAEELNIPVGAQYIATGGAFVSSASGIEALYWNPAGLDKAGKSEAMFSRMSYIADMNLNYIAVSGHMGDLGTVAFSVKSLDFGDIVETSVASPDGDGSTFSPSAIVAGVSYAKALTDRISGGATVKFIHEGIMDVSANGFAVDFGAQYRFSNNLSLGVALKNIGGNMRFTGGDLEQKAAVDDSSPTSSDGVFEALSDKFNIPSNFQFGIAYDYAVGENNSIQLASTFQNANESDNSLRFGAEYSFNNLFFLRGGYDMLTEETDNSVFGASFGAGLNYAIGGVDVVFDYAYRDVDVFDANHVFSVKFGIGGN